MHLRPRRKLAAQLKTVCRPVTMRVFYNTLVTKRPHYQRNNSYELYEMYKLYKTSRSTRMGYILVAAPSHGAFFRPHPLGQDGPEWSGEAP